MTLSLVKLAEVGAARCVAADPGIVTQIRGFEQGPESQLSAQQDKLLRAVVKAAVADPKKASQVTDALVSSGKAASIVEAVETRERALDQYGQYVPLLKEYRFDEMPSEFGDRTTWRQPESIAEMSSRIRGVVGKKGQIIWPEAFEIAQKHYGNETWKGKSPIDHTVFPFVTGSNGKHFFGPEGQEDYLVGKKFDGKPLVVADYGADLISLSLSLMNQGFPGAQPEWKVSRAFVNNGESDKAARLAAVDRNECGVDAYYSYVNPSHYDFVGASLESQK